MLKPVYVSVAALVLLALVSGPSTAPARAIEAQQTAARLPRGAQLPSPLSRDTCTSAA